MNYTAVIFGQARSLQYIVDPACQKSIMNQLMKMELPPEFQESLLTFVKQYYPLNPNSLTAEFKILQILAVILRQQALLTEQVNKPIIIPDRPHFCEDIKDFHTKFQQAYFGAPRHLSPEEKEFRCTALYEEIDEYKDATTVAMEFDALVDLVYFALGTAYRQGLPFEKGWILVHAANMLKKLVTKKGESKRGFDQFDIVKPEGWQAPDLIPLCEKQD